VSDFGFDAHALGEADSAESPHPLEIARDLIARGKARAALELLSGHHEGMADDPEYLLVCSEAWCAEGDALRAQQALLGAARVAPEDPRPLLWLGELFSELGEHEKAQRVMAKGRALSERPSWTAVSEDDEAPAPDEDLIAFAERQERRTQSALSPKHLALGIAALVFIGLTVAGIASVTSGPDDTLDPPEPVADAPATPPEREATPEIEIETLAEERELEPILPTPIREAAMQAEPAPPPSIETAAAVPEAPPPAPREKAASKPRKPKAPSRDPEPSTSVVQAELASMNPQQLTLRADALYARGHSGLAATYYRRALELDPDYAPALVGIGRNTLRAKRYSEAMRNATRALELARGVDARPGLEAAALYQMGRVHFEQGERDAARRLLRQSISLPGTPPQAWFYLGEALSSDNSPVAREAYERYLELVPQGSLADRARRAIR
jgi:tetratricopeptide (TPR) repeat protein